jgi:SAM-dependent methyltransferase
VRIDWGSHLKVETSLVECERKLLRRCLSRPAQRVLEAGCGRRDSRADSLAIPELGIRTVVGVDMDVDAGLANRGLDEFFAADLCASLPFPAETFDLVYACFVVEHLEEPASAFREWRRVVRGDGAVLVVTPNLANPLMRLAARLPHGARLLLKRLGPGVDPRDVFPTPYRANTASQIRLIAAASAFAVCELHHVATLHRYAGDRRLMRGLLLASEAVLPAERRSTLVVLLRPVAPSQREANPGVKAAASAPAGRSGTPA